MKSLLLAMSVIVPFVAACGAKTGLLVPDIGFDSIDAVDITTVDDTSVPCMPGRFPLERRSAEIVLLLDRSGSMAENLDGRMMTPPRRWDVLHDALQMSLRPFESQIAMGALAFPRRFDGTMRGACGIHPALDVEPGLGRANDILAVLEGSDPWGGTPTFDAVAFVGNTLVSRLSRSRSESMVIATDGGPNCNSSLNPMTCQCESVSASGQPSCFGDGANCLDDLRASSIVGDFLTRGVPTYIIGLDSTALPIERSALQRMAVAGGRPDLSPGGTGYYSAREPAHITAALQTIQQQALQCTLATPSRPDDPSSIRIEFQGTVVPHDPSHADGWDWTDLNFGQITFFGPACTRIVAAAETPVAIVDTCHAG